MKIVTPKMRRRILAMYFEDDRKPIKIYRMTGVPLDKVREVIKDGYRHPSHQFGASLGDVRGKL